MIKNLSINNFKDLNLRTKRINLFIGETNIGKSNILETLGLLIWCNYLSSDLIEYVRLHGIQNLFYNRLLVYLEIGTHVTNCEACSSFCQI